MSFGVRSGWLINALARKGGRMTNGVCLKIVLLLGEAEDEAKSSSEVMERIAVGVGVRKDMGLVHNVSSKMIG